MVQGLNETRRVLILICAFKDLLSDRKKEQRGQMLHKHNLKKYIIELQKTPDYLD